MKQLQTLSELSNVGHPVTMAVGAFDGVHLGHLSLIERARSEAARYQGSAWVLTFEPHPMRVLHAELAPDLLTTPHQRLTILEQTGIEGVIIMPFTEELVAWEPERFIEHLATAVPTLKEIVAGMNWRFGHGARGDSDLLKQLAERHGFSACIMEPVRWGDAPVSSTRIREAITRGHVEEATAMLGRPFSIAGEVVHGRKYGRELGFPTANVKPENELEPPPGIYAVRVLLGDTWHPGAAYLASSPADDTKVVEVFIIDGNPQLYGQAVEVRFIKWLREDRHFEHPDDLKNQIARDVAEAKNVLQHRS